MICVHFHYITMIRTERSGDSRSNKQKSMRFSAWAISNLPLKNPWQALRAATEKAAREGDLSVKNPNLERFFALARTHFSTKS